MLIKQMSKSTWLVAALAAAVALVAGVVVAAGLRPVHPSEPAGLVDLAAQPEDCNQPNDPNCSIGEHEDGEDPPPDIGDGSGGGGPCTWTSGGGVITVSLAAQGGETIEIPCVHPQYGFFDGDHCYWSSDYPFPYEPPAAPPDGENAEDGQWYYGTCFNDAYYFNGELVLQIQAALFDQWFNNAEVPVITPEQVALDWLANVALFGIDFALAPPETGAGLVTLPVWLGVNGAADSWGPLSDTHCITGVCVSISAEVATVDWTMGDGTSFSCDRGEHIAWQSGTHDYLRPEGCHHYYQRASRNQPDGRYAITATSNWAVHWESDVSDAAGDLTATREASTALQIDEIQVLTR